MDLPEQCAARRRTNATLLHFRAIITQLCCIIKPGPAGARVAVGGQEDVRAAGRRYLAGAGSRTTEGGAVAGAAGAAAAGPSDSASVSR